MAALPLPAPVSLSSSLRLSSIVVLGVVSSMVSAGATCYRPDGTAVDSTYQPCISSQPYSMCCHLGLLNNDGDRCGGAGTSSYGLCGISSGATQIWRESCTDPTWKSPACLRLCIDGDNRAHDVTITACSNGSYCCGANNGTCCDAGQGQWIVNNAVSNTSSSSSSSSSASASTSSSSSSTISLASSSTTSSTSNTPTNGPQTAASIASSPSSSATLDPSPGMQSSTKIGLGVGIPVGVICLSLVAFCLFRHHRRRSSLRQGTVEIDNHNRYPVGSTGPSGSSDMSPAEGGGGGDGMWYNFGRGAGGKDGVGYRNEYYEKGSGGTGFTGRGEDGRNMGMGRGRGGGGPSDMGIERKMGEISGEQYRRYHEMDSERPVVELA